MNEMALRELAERMFHDIDRTRRDLKAISDLLAKDKAVSEDFKTWFFKKLGDVEGWEEDLRA